MQPGMAQTPLEVGYAEVKPNSVVSHPQCYPVASLQAVSQAASVDLYAAVTAPMVVNDAPQPQMWNTALSGYPSPPTEHQKAFQTQIQRRPVSQAPVSEDTQSPVSLQGIYGFPPPQNAPPSPATSTQIGYVGTPGQHQCLPHQEVQQGIQEPTPPVDNLYFPPMSPQNADSPSHISFPTTQKGAPYPSMFSPTPNTSYSTGPQAPMSNVQGSIPGICSTATQNVMSPQIQTAAPWASPPPAYSPPEGLQQQAQLPGQVMASYAQLEPQSPILQGVPGSGQTVVPQAIAVASQTGQNNKQQLMYVPVQTANGIEYMLVAVPPGTSLVGLNSMSAGAARLWNSTKEKTKKTMSKENAKKAYEGSKVILSKTYRATEKAMTPLAPLIPVLGVIHPGVTEAYNLARGISRGYKIYQAQNAAAMGGALQAQGQTQGQVPALTQVEMQQLLNQMQAQVVLQTQQLPDQVQGQVHGQANKVQGAIHAQPPVTVSSMTTPPITHMQNSAVQVQNNQAAIYSHQHQQLLGQVQGQVPGPSPQTQAGTYCSPPASLPNMTKMPIAETQNQPYPQQQPQKTPQSSDALDDLGPLTNTLMRIAAQDNQQTTAQDQASVQRVRHINFDSAPPPDTSAWISYIEITYGLASILLPPSNNIRPTNHDCFGDCLRLEITLPSVQATCLIFLLYSPSILQGRLNAVVDPKWDHTVFQPLGPTGDLGIGATASYEMAHDLTTDAGEQRGVYRLFLQSPSAWGHGLALECEAPTAQLAAARATVLAVARSIRWADRAGGASWCRDASASVAGTWTFFDSYSSCVPGGPSVSYRDERVYTFDVTVPVSGAHGGRYRYDRESLISGQAENTSLGSYDPNHVAGEFAVYDYDGAWTLVLKEDGEGGSWGQVSTFKLKPQGGVMYIGRNKYYKSS